MQVSEATMPVTEFQYNSPSKLRHVVDNGEPLHVRYHGRPYTTVVPTALWAEAQAALMRERASERADHNAQEAAA